MLTVDLAFVHGEGVQPSLTTPWKFERILPALRIWSLGYADQHIQMLSVMLNLHRNLTCVILAALPILLVGACDSDTKWSLESEESERYSFTRFMEGIEKFPYVADQQKSSRVREGFKLLSLGMRKHDVKKLMGEPDSEIFDYPKSKKNRELIGSSWGYYLKRFESRLATEGFDEAVFLYFKPSEELYWAQPENVPGLKQVGGPRPKDSYLAAQVPIGSRAVTLQSALTVGLAGGYLLAIVGAIGMVVFAMRFPFSSRLKDLPLSAERFGPFNGYQVWIGSWLLIILGSILQLVASVALAVFQR